MDVGMARGMKSCLSPSFQHQSSLSNRSVFSSQEYIDAHPETIVLDPLPAIRTLLDRSKSYELIRKIEAYMKGTDVSGSASVAVGPPRGHKVVITWGGRRDGGPVFLNTLTQEAAVRSGEGLSFSLCDQQS